ncbi:ATP-binding protein [Actinokineospora pegani]|uniref:ATP-binding protein n=1 Tax=Actinokineospora pegani TaxID=2654637 RepID=UPI0018D4D22B|nr:ATP-binding protein [Actinokineospora pegani]
MNDLVNARVDGFSVEVPGRGSELGRVRRCLGGWLSARGIARGLATDILLAVDEAMANSVEHGYRDTDGGHVRVAATVGGPHLTVTISDNGSWRPPRFDPAAHRGRGLDIMRALADTVTVDTGDGTTVTLVLPLAEAPGATRG